ncbi:TPR domain-containing [Lecanosticta acicola]|uniref:TPR domain-containing n=1 Tax=Lecanosticta acicola TaxID=111012 RepID=A0AAI9EF27_9PEZI|nr:TPR domain-containing [Lecanosticta acicola]
MFAIRPTPGKGLGVFSTTNITRGSRILSEKALISVQGDSQWSILSAADGLDSSARLRFLDLSINQAKHVSWLSRLHTLWISKSKPLSFSANHTILNVFRNNNFDIGKEIRALFPQVARLNHACVPNAQGNFHPSLNEFTIHATKDIATNEEITISYLKHQFASREVRQQHLSSGYGFHCDCPACKSDSPLGQASEARRENIRQRLEAFATKASSSEENSEGELVVLKHLLVAYEEEGIRGREVATMYMAAAKLALAQSDKCTARELAKRGLELEEEAIGTDSPIYQDTLKEASSMMS